MNWSKEERNQFSKLLILTAKIYDKVIDFDVCQLILDDLQDLNFETCMNALVKFRRDPKNKSWPRAADIRALVSPQIDKRALSIELAHAIDKAVARHGWNWEDGFYGADGNYWEDSNGARFNSFKEAVISELGPIGWHAICSRGGWRRVRDSANTMEEGTFIAQMRDHVQSTITLQEMGLDLAKIEMPKREQLETGLVKVNPLKMLGVKKDEV